MLGGFANRRAQLQPQIEPVADFFDQAHLVFPPVSFATG